MTKAKKKMSMILKIQERTKGEGMLSIYMKAMKKSMTKMKTKMMERRKLPRIRITMKNRAQSSKISLRKRTMS